MNQSEEVREPQVVLSKWAWRSYLPHFLISVLTGLILFVVLIYSAWVNLRNDRMIFPEPRYTRMQLQIVSESVKQFEEAHDRLPVALNELDDIDIRVLGSSPGPFADQWGREFQYEVQDDKTFVIYSLGLDGKLGGIGLDADLYHDDQDHEQTLPTFRQFYVEGHGTNGILGDGGFFCFAISIFLFSLLIRQDSDPARPVHLAWLILSAMVLFGLSAACGVGLLPLHIPSGH